MYLINSLTESCEKKNLQLQQDHQSFSSNGNQQMQSEERKRSLFVIKAQLSNSTKITLPTPLLALHKIETKEKMAHRGKKEKSNKENKKFNDRSGKKNKKCRKAGKGKLKQRDKVFVEDKVTIDYLQREKLWSIK